MRQRARTLFAVALCAGCGTTAAAPDMSAPPAPDMSAPPMPAQDPPIIPVGFDAFRQWDHWPYLRIGTRTQMRSTYDRTGGNESADASHFLREDAPDHWVTLDVTGPGVLYFIRTNHWHGSPWHYVVDGTDWLIAESATANPNQPVAGSVFLPSAPFPPPLALTWSTTAGADINAVPIAFEQSLELAYSRTHYGTGYYIYQQFPEGAENLSQPLHAWAEGAPDADVVALLGRAGDDFAPTGADVRSDGGTIDLAAGAAVAVDLPPGPRMVRALRFTVPLAAAAGFAEARLRITWDGRAQPSVEAPLPLFFGTGSLYNRDGREFLVKAFPVNIRFDPQSIHFAAYFPMPYLRSARLELVGGSDGAAGIDWQIVTQPYSDPGNWVGYFHATYHDQGVPTPGQDLVLLDTTMEEGGADWCGSFIGNSMIFSDRANLTPLEGDPRFFFDDSQTPQAQGTGTEEWGGGGDYWGGATTTLPFFGHPVGAPDPTLAQSADDQIESVYRYLLADLMPFGRNARIQFEHGGVDDSTDHYRTLAYWYGLPGACLVPTDSFHVGDPDDEARHQYVSPDASSVDTLTSRYEWGVDHFNGMEVYPATTDSGRHTTGTTEFTMAIRPANYGVLLRRKLDYGYPDQRAEVWVADGAGGDFARAGIWYLAGSNQCLYSFPPGELGSDSGTIETSNRRFRDDEFLIPRHLTDGRSAIRIQIRFVPSNTPLQPGAPLGNRAWSELRYWAYSWELPAMP
jgi:hypothetical protein